MRFDTENLYEVTNLCKQQGHHIPRGSFARMINFMDANPSRKKRRETALVKKDQAEVKKAINLQESRRMSRRSLASENLNNEDI